MILQHNMTAIYTSRQVKNVKGEFSKNAEKLASGYQINRSADNAAGLAISEKMRGQIRGLEQASQNAQDGVSMLLTADGALNETQSLVHRIRELSVQAANDTNTDEDREIIQTEIEMLLEEVDRIAEDTEFNTIKLLNGSLEGTVSSNPIRQVYTAEVADFLENVVVNPIVDSSVNKIDGSVSGALSTTLKDSIVPQAVNAFLDTFPVFNSAVADGQVSNQIGLKIYQDNSNTLAYVANRYSYNTSTNEVVEIQLNLGVNVNTLNFDSNGDLTEDSRRALETTIVHEMMHAFMDDTLTNGMIGAVGGVLNASNKFPSWFTEGMAQVAAGGCSNDNDWVNGNGGLGLTGSSTTDAITATVKSSVNNLESGSTSSEYGTGYLACMYLGYLAEGKPSTFDSTTLARGVNTVLQKIMDGSSLNDAIKDISGGTYTSLDDFESKFGDSESAHFIKNLLTAVGDAGNGSVVSTLTDNDLLDDGNATSSVYKINEAEEFVVSSVGNNRDWGSGGATSPSGNGSGPGAGSGNTGGTGGSGGGGGTGGTGGTTFTGAFHLQIGANAGQAMGVSIGDMHAAAIGLTGISVLDHTNAGLAIAACDKAIENISSTRSQIGAYTNRLEHAIANVDNTAENLQTAESRIRDTDMAKVMVEYSKENILMQAGQAMLAQANKTTQGILNLLQ